MGGGARQEVKGKKARSTREERGQEAVRGHHLVILMREEYLSLRSVHIEYWSVLTNCPCLCDEAGEAASQCVGWPLVQEVCVGCFAEHMCQLVYRICPLTSKPPCI